MDNLFERLFNIYISEEFDRNSIYYDEKTNQKFSYKKIVNYLEKYFRHNTIDEEKMCLYHEKRRNIDFFNVNIVYHKKIFSKFIDGDFNYIEDAIKYVERYSSKEELEQYKNILKKYYTQYQSDFEKFENNRFIDSYNNPAHKELPISLLMHEYVTYILKEDYLMYKRKKSLTTSKSYIYLTKILECDNLETFAKELYEQKIEIID